MDSRDDPGPLLPVIGVDLIDKAPLRLALILETDMDVSLGLGLDLDNAEINSPFPGTPCQPDACLIGHVLILVPAGPFFALLSTCRELPFGNSLI
jgi:hypothetical protein